MESRREFCRKVVIAGALSTTGALEAAAPVARAKARPAGGETGRSYWVNVMDRLAAPVLGHLARRELKEAMPVETTGNPADRRRYTHLEAFGRLLAGMAPWLAAQGLAEAEAKRQQYYLELAHRSLDAATDPHSPDFMNFHHGAQPLVDAAFLAQAILRAPKALWEPLTPRVRRQLIEALKSSRVIRPGPNNWVLFAVLVEMALLEWGEPTLEPRLEGYLRQMLSYYKGDGAYGDGRFFHWDYYNSFVIQPMLVDSLALLSARDARFKPAYHIVLARARRYAEILERLIAPDGTFPSIGRSTTYRFGAMQVLAQLAWRHELPSRLQPAAVRSALTAVVHRLIEAPGTFDAKGWLQIGFCGHQPSLGEGYISTGSLYLCSVGLLPLGLSPADPFWTDSPARWTSQRLAAGESLLPDHAMHDTAKPVKIPTLRR